MTHGSAVLDRHSHSPHTDLYIYERKEAGINKDNKKSLYLTTKKKERKKEKELGVAETEDVETALGMA